MKLSSRLSEIKSKTHVLWSLVLGLSLLVVSHDLYAAACCGGGFAAPSLIAGDDAAQFSSSYALNQVVVESVDGSGIWRNGAGDQSVQTLRLEGAHIFADRWQAGFVVPMIERSRPGENAKGLSDIALSLGYEYLPDWNYHPIRPKGLGYLQLVLPTGKAKAESDGSGLDMRGNGFWSVGAGTLLTKIIRKYDVVTSLEVHHSFGKDINTSLVSGRLVPGNGGSLMFGAGYNTEAWRLGSAITWTYEDPVALEQGIASIDGSVERYATAIASASYMASDEWAGTLSYSDQTLFGAPVNTSLGRGLMLQLQRRWAR